MTADPDIKILSVPYTPALEDNSYLPASLSNQDYPALVAEGKPVDTIAVGAVLAVYNWARDSDRYRRVARFTDSLFGKLPDLQKPPRHPKWREVNVAATLKGWKRFQPAQDWLDRNQTAAAPQAAAGASAQAAQAAAAGVDVTLARDQAQRAAPGNPAEQERLFQKFLEWSRQQKR